MVTYTVLQKQCQQQLKYFLVIKNFVESVDSLAKSVLWPILIYFFLLLVNRSSFYTTFG